MTGRLTLTDLQLALELIPAVVSVSRLEDDRVVAVNDRFLLTTGFEREEVIGRHAVDVGLWIPATERERRATAPTEGRPWRDIETRLRTKSGEERVVIASTGVVTLESGVHVVTTFTDVNAWAPRGGGARGVAEITATARADDPLLRLLGHELRNPLGTIVTAVGMLGRLATDDDVRQLAAIIGRQATQMTRLVTDLLDVARATTGGIELQREIVDLREVAARCLAALRTAGGGPDHDVTIEGESVRVNADPARLEQVVRHLLENAFRYTPPEGRVRVVTARAGDDATLRVQDTGEGIPADTLPWIFDIFDRPSYLPEPSRRGLDVGLALSKHLVELHGGSVAASSAGPGRGSDFVIRLPAVGAGEPGGTTAGSATAPSALRRRILIVDDSPDARESLRLLLELAGHEVETSEDGTTGLAKLFEYRPDVALIDLALPGLDGFAIARAARRSPETRGMRLIALTGYGDAEDRERAMAAGFDVHLTKPVDPDRLERLVTARE
jgi:PAS domain S-box-containing protein